MNSVRSSVLLAYIAAVLTAILVVQLVHDDAPIIIASDLPQVQEDASPMTDEFQYDPDDYGSGPSGAVQISYKRTVASTYDLKPYQVENFRIARNAGKPHDRERLVMALLWRETRAGKFGPVGDLGNGFGKRSYGLWQMKVATALDVLKSQPELWGKRKKWQSNEEVIARLISEPKWAAEMAMGNITRLERRRVPYGRIPLAWNEGVRGSHGIDADDHEFTVDVLETVQSPMIRELVVSL